MPFRFGGDAVHVYLTINNRAGVCLAAARHASGLGPVAYDDPVDLSEYDIAYTKEDE